VATIGVAGALATAVAGIGGYRLFRRNKRGANPGAKRVR